MAGPRVYIHEFIDIIGHGRAKYMYHMTANWVPVGIAERNQRCFGVWGVVGSTGTWPQVVNLWEYDDWAALGHNFEVEQRGLGLQDPSLERWWRAAAEFRSGGVDRILVAAPWSPSVADHERSFTAPPAGYVHEHFRVKPGHDLTLLDAIRDAGIDAYETAGLRLVGAFRRAMAGDDEVIAIWAFANWQVWADFEAALDPLSTQSGDIDCESPCGLLHAWFGSIAGIVRGRERILLADAPLSPLRIGRQPDESDRTTDA